MIRQIESVIIVIITALDILTFSNCSQQSRTEVTIPAAEVDVVNGTGIHRLARAVEQELLSRGFNVYGTGDAVVHYQRTVVRDLRDPQGKTAQAVARALAVKRRFLCFHWGEQITPEVEVEIDSSRFIDVEIILGDDYQRFFPQVVPLY